MNIQSMEYIIALAKMLNFTKASTAMFTTQPAFSRIISSAEEELGVAIFERSKRHVKLTPAGETLIPHFESLLKLYDEGVRNARDVTEKRSGRLVIGYIPDTMNQDIALFTRRFSAKWPDIKVSLHEKHYYDINNQLHTGELDAVIYTSMQIGFPPEFECCPLSESPLCAIVSDMHKLADREEIFPMELRDEKFVVLEHDETLSGGWSFLHRFAAARGFTPRIAERASMLPSVLFQVSCNKGIGIASQFAVHPAPENVRVIPINGNERCIRYAIWLRENQNPALAGFIECLKENLEIWR